MTIRIPRWLLAILALVVAAGAGFALATALTGEDEQDGANGTEATETLPCTEQEGLDAAKSVGEELTGDPKLAREIGKDFGMQVVELECADLTGDGISEMLVELGCCTGSAPDPWAIFAPEDGAWEPLFLRAGVNNGGVEIAGNELIEELPVYGEGDPSADPRGTKTVRFIVGDDGTVEYRPPKLPTETTLSAERLGEARAGEFDARVHGPQEARQIFGEPTEVFSSADESCDFGWQDLGLRILFANFGGENACRDGAAQEIRAGGFAAELVGWQTDRGVTVGARSIELFDAYPEATEGIESGVPAVGATDADVWVLQTQATPYGDAGRTPALSAEVDNGRVVALVLNPTAAGD